MERAEQILGAVRCPDSFEFHAHEGLNAMVCGWQEALDCREPQGSIAGVTEGACLPKSWHLTKAAAPSAPTSAGAAH